MGIMAADLAVFLVPEIARFDSLNKAWFFAFVREVPSIDT